MTNQDAPGAPGITPRWTSSAKQGIGTAYHTSSRVWFTVSHGVINEIYHPHLDTPNTRDLQLLVSDGEMRHGEPTGSAMPLCWSHAELLSLIRSHQDGMIDGRIAPVYRRYAKDATVNKTEVWTFAHQPISVAAGKPLRIIVEAATGVRWTCDDWKCAQKIETETLSIGLHFVDLPIANLEGGRRLALRSTGRTVANGRRKSSRSQCDGYLN